MLLQKGLKGQRKYTYTALENQIKKYPSLTAKLADTENLDEEGKAYSEKEAFYNQYVYETNLELPESVETELKEILGEYTLQMAVLILIIQRRNRIFYMC